VSNRDTVLALIGVGAVELVCYLLIRFDLIPRAKRGAPPVPIIKQLLPVLELLSRVSAVLGLLSVGFGALLWLAGW
jgi:hypothetical protein